MAACSEIVSEFEIPNWTEAVKKSFSRPPLYPDLIKYLGEVISCGHFALDGILFCCYIFPNSRSRPDETGREHVGIYLGVVDANTLPDGWSICIKFNIDIWDYRGKWHVGQKASVKLCEKIYDFGWSKFEYMNSYARGLRGMKSVKLRVSCELTGSNFTLND